MLDTRVTNRSMFESSSSERKAQAKEANVHMGMGTKGSQLVDRTSVQKGEHLNSNSKQEPWSQDTKAHAGIE